MIHVNEMEHSVEISPKNSERSDIQGTGVDGAIALGIVRHGQGFAMN